MDTHLGKAIIERVIRKIPHQHRLQCREVCLQERKALRSEEDVFDPLLSLRAAPWDILEVWVFRTKPQSRGVVAESSVNSAICPNGHSFYNSYPHCSAIAFAIPSNSQATKILIPPAIPIPLPAPPAFA